MIRIKSNSDAAHVSGNPVEVMFFFTVWQTRLWPGWVDTQLTVGASEDATKQHMGAIAETKEGSAIDLYNRGPEYRAALDSAGRLCEKYGITVSSCHDE